MPQKSMSLQGRENIRQARLGTKASAEARVNMSKAGRQETCLNGHILSDTRRTSPSGQTHCVECLNTKNRRPLRSIEKYNITLDEYNAMFVAQDGRCAICGTDKFPGVGHTLHIDHDHITGKVRSLLCQNCNIGLGLFGDSPELMIEATNYLREHV